MNRDLKNNEKKGLLKLGNRYSERLENQRANLARLLVTQNKNSGNFLNKNVRGKQNSDTENG